MNLRAFLLSVTAALYVASINVNLVHPVNNRKAIAIALGLPVRFRDETRKRNVEDKELNKCNPDDELRFFLHHLGTIFCTIS